MYRTFFVNAGITARQIRRCCLCLGHIIATVFGRDVKRVSFGLRTVKSFHERTVLFLWMTSWLVRCLSLKLCVVFFLPDVHLNGWGPWSVWFHTANWRRTKNFASNDCSLCLPSIMLSYVDLYNPPRIHTECCWTKGSVSVHSRRFLEERHVWNISSCSDWTWPRCKFGAAHYPQRASGESLGFSNPCHLQDENTLCKQPDHNIPRRKKRMPRLHELSYTRLGESHEICAGEKINAGQHSPQFLAIEPHFVRKGCRGSCEIAFYLSFWRLNLISGERVAAEVVKSQFHLSFWRSNVISCERVAAEVVKSQFYFRFWRSNLISCENAAAEVVKSQFHLSSWRSNVISCERVAAEVVKSQFYFRFWRSNLISCEKVAAEVVKSQFFLSFWRSNLISCERVAFRAVSLALPRAFKREIDKKERARGQESKRAREQEGKRARGQESKRAREKVKMWRCEDEKMRRGEDVKMKICEDVRVWRCEDEKMWRWEDVKMRGCEDVRMWGCEDVKMRSCEDEKM